MLKKILAVFGLLIATIVVAAATFWFGWLTPPDSDAVCTNVDRVMADKNEKMVKEAGIAKKMMEEELEKVQAKMVKSCKRFSTKKPLTMARHVWVKQLECMRDADAWDSLQSCNDIKSL